MALPHAAAAEVIAAGPLGAALASARSQTLVRDRGLQIFRLVLAPGQVLAPHKVRDRMVIQCLDGSFEFEAMGRRLTLRTGDLCHIPPEEDHAVRAIEACSALVTLFGLDTHEPPATGEQA
jgi:quercetin dioxygenase-like cupin family protein